jgi:hypothetical protein
MFRDTAASIARMTLISTSASQSKVDSTCLSFPSYFRTQLTHILGTLVNSTTAASIELNVAIIAASLVVMRPCFKAIFGLFPWAATHSSLSGEPNSSYSSYGSVLASIKGKAKERPRGRTRECEEDANLKNLGANTGITKTVDIELSTRNLSTEEILQSKDRLDN